ncbi:DUF4267 domain-containing protein [Catenuloplanes japonicus]|uniref:DUF4267 domain-containing protein n=1 Tax=Catenuloplanes japonicus TaxID=33876 RepID=UPI001E456049|nr:DUF4267 domain-containing protein [Catenuloplanes japonicus]
MGFVAYGLAVLLNLFIIVIGVRFLLVPEASAAGYGVPDRTSAYRAVKGVRDLSFGLIGLALLAFAGAWAAAWFMLAAAVVPFGDTVIVLRNGGSRATAFGIHFATAAAVLVSAALLFAA